MALRVAVQYGCDPVIAPDRQSFRKWARAAISVLDPVPHCDITVRIVETGESQALNERFRHGTGPTNVLSFSYDNCADPSRISGDIVICAAIVREEARAQGKAENAHWAHMVVHAIMHLCGHDHETPDEAARMEALEVHALTAAGFGNPYD
ncbi:MAG: rRNA maturation RNase YbeY [Acidiferrobacteraceae bacterium]